MMHKSTIRKGFYSFIVGFTLLWTVIAASGDVDKSEQKKILYFEIHQDIFPSAWRNVKSAIEEAEEIQADYILLSLDTYGGMLDAADSIRTKLLETQIPVVVHITNNAASAGALIAIACDSIYMTSYAKIGAASVVDQSGQVMPDKYQSYMRGIMRSTAETNNRNPEMAEAMVGAIKTIPGIIDSGSVLTLTTSEALQYGFCDGEAANAEDALIAAGITNYELVKFSPSFIDKMMGFFLNPVVRGLCLTFIFLGLYFELQSPGIGFPLIIAITAALLYFAPLYFEGLAENWEVLLFVVGLILIVLEIFVIPGFGIAGISGIAFVVTGLLLSMLQNRGFNFDFTGTGVIVESFAVVVGSLIVSLTFILGFFGRFLNSKIFKKISLQTSETAEEGYNTNIPSLIHFVDKTGIAVSDLRPAGKIEIDGEWIDGQTEGEYISKGERVKVLEAKNSFLVVRRVNR